MTKQEWGVIAKMLADFYPHSFKIQDPGAVKNWFMGLADLQGERVAAAVWTMVRTQPAFPSVADIRRLAEGSADAAAEAWAEALKLATGPGAAPEHRAYVPNGRIEVIDGKVRRLDAQTSEVAPLQFSDPILEKAIGAIGGLAVIAYGDLSTLETRRAQFLKLYQGFAAEHKRCATFEALGVPAAPPSLTDGRKADTPTRLGAIAQSITPPNYQEEITP